MTAKQFEGARFEAQFASENPSYSSLVTLPGLDGFVFSVDPLFKVGQGFIDVMR